MIQTPTPLQYSHIALSQHPTCCILVLPAKPSLRISHTESIVMLSRMSLFNVTLALWNPLKNNTNPSCTSSLKPQMISSIAKHSSPIDHTLSIYPLQRYGESTPPSALSGV